MQGRHRVVGAVAGSSGEEARAATSYNQLLLSDGELGRRTHQALVDAHARHDLLFQDRLLCTVLRPRFMSPHRLAAMTRVSEILADIFERAGEALLSADSMLDLIGASDAERSIWSVDPGYPGFTLSSRLDSFLVDEKPRFVEYNAESPAGIGYTDSLTEIFQQLPAMQSWMESRDLQPFHGRRHLLDTLLSAYQAWGGSEPPTMAVVDWSHVMTRRDFELCAAYFREQGVPAVVVDPRALEYRGGRLWSGSDPITLVYRRVLLHELLAKADECAALLQAYGEGAICMVNSPRSKILHKKAVFALLGDGRLGLSLTAEEQRVVDETVPWTRLLCDGKTSHQGRIVDLLPFVAAHRDQLVLKPYDDYGGRGVVLGWEQDDDSWKRAIETALQSNYVVQEKVPVADAAFPVWSGSAVELVPLLLDTDPLLFRGRVGSMLTRLSGTALLNVSAGAGSTTPTFIVTEKEG